MIRRRSLIAVAAAAVLGGWWLAAPESGGPGLSDESIGLPADAVASLGGAPAGTALRELYRRRAWSAVPPPDDNGETADGNGVGDAGAEPPPEGLDRFKLVGVIRVQGQPQEALLLDQAAARTASGDTAARELRAREGDSLRDSGVRLDRIEGTRVRLTHAGKTRWLELFRRGRAPEKAPPGDADQSG